jgi:hypothetical protein
MIAGEGIIHENIKKAYEITQEVVGSSYSNFANSMEKIVGDDGPFDKMETLYEKLMYIENNIDMMLNKVEERRDDLNKYFNNKYGATLDGAKKFFADEDVNDEVLRKNEFFLIEIDITLNYNEIVKLSAKALNLVKDEMSKLKILMMDYMNLLKETINVYLAESKKLYSATVALAFEKIQLLYESINKESVESNFSVDKFFKNDIAKDFNDILTIYRKNLSDYEVVQHDHLKVDDRFKIENIKNFDDLLDLFISLNPKPLDYSFDFVDYVTEVRRDPGIFKSWRTVVLVMTKQKNVIIFDDKISNKDFILLYIPRLTVKPKEDKKNPYRFELCETKKGILFNSNVNVILDAVTPDIYKELMLRFENKDFDLFVKRPSLLSRDSTKDRFFGTVLTRSKTFTLNIK